MSSRLLDYGDETWEKWIVEQCGLDYYDYPEKLTMRILEDSLDKIINRIEELKLSLSNNSLIIIPKEICKLGKLKKLILSHNKITSLPNEICKLESLELLWIDDNQITSLPSSLKLLDLKDFDISKNPINFKI